MRKKRNLSKVLLGALALTLIPVSAVSAQKITPSSSCKVLNQKVVYQNKTYTCIKSGKTLIWNNGVTFKATESQTNPFTGEGAAERALLDAGLGIRCIPGEFCPISSTGPGGGKVFYDAGSQQSWGQYLEVAPKGWSGKAVDPSELWCNLANSDLSKKVSDLSLRESLGHEIGKGKANTNLMLAFCKSGAAVRAHKYKGGGKKDWYLPSSHELDELCKWASYQPTGDDEVSCSESSFKRKDFFPSFHWSSTESEASHAWIMFPLAGANTSKYFPFDVLKKDVELYIRPIRAF